MQYIRASSGQSAAAKFHPWLAIGMMYGRIGRPRLGAIPC